MPIERDAFERMERKKTNLEKMVDFLKEDGRAWSVSELARELSLDPAIISEISRRHDGKEVIRKQDGRRVWVALNKEGAIAVEDGEKTSDLDKLIHDFMNDKIARGIVDWRDDVCGKIRNGIHANMTVKEFQKLISPLRGEKNSIRNNRFGNRIKTQEQLDKLLDALESETFEEAAKKIADVEGIGMDVLSMMMHIMHPDKYHCVNGQLLRVTDELMLKKIIPKEQLHKYMTCKTPSGVNGFINTYKDYERVLNAIQSQGNMKKSDTDFFIGWLKHDMRRRYSLGDVSLSGL